MSVADRLKNINQRIQNACVRAGRDPAEVKLLAVSKMQSLQAIREAYDAGQRHFAENYVQEAMVKLDQLQTLPVEWHFIGRIQSNKIKLLTPFHFVHSVDRPGTADALNRQAGKTLPPRRQEIFLQFNVAGEASKAGMEEIELENMVNFIAPMRNVRLVGLMVMPPATEDPEAVRPFFVRARKFLEHLREQMGEDVLEHHPLNQLSMGTSQDFEVAIEEGATWIRIGSDIFGPRPEKL